MYLHHVGIPVVPLICKLKFFGDKENYFYLLKIGDAKNIIHLETNYLKIQLNFRQS